MRDYEFRFVVEGLDVEDFDQLDRLYEAIPELVASSSAGLVTLGFVVEAEGEWAALSTAHSSIDRLAPEVKIIRLDPELVSIPDIAVRTDLSPEGVRLLANGERGPGGFPGPIGVLRGGTRVWEWARVYEWMRGIGRLDDSPQPIDPECAAIFNARLANGVGPSKTPEHQHVAAPVFISSLFVRSSSVEWTSPITAAQLIVPTSPISAPSAIPAWDSDADDRLLALREAWLSLREKGALHEG